MVVEQAPGAVIRKTRFKVGYSATTQRVFSRKEKTRTDSVQKVCGGVWQDFDHLTKLESSKVQVVWQGGLKSSSIIEVK